MNSFTIKLDSLRLPYLSAVTTADQRTATMEFHVSRKTREEHGFDKALFALRGNVILTDFKAVREFTQRLNSKINPITHPERFIKAGQLNAMGLIDEILHYVAALYREQVAPDAFETALAKLETDFGKQKVDELLTKFTEMFPPRSVYSGETSVADYLSGTDGGEKNRLLVLEELMLLKLANLNPAFSPFKRLFDDSDLALSSIYSSACETIAEHFTALPPFGPDSQNLWEMLRSPAIAEPLSLSAQLEYIRKHWGLVIGKFLIRLMTGLDVVREEEKPVFFGPGPTHTYIYDDIQHEYERFSPDKDWMPSIVLMAKSTLVWLSQLSIKYQRPIYRLDMIPDEELDELSRRGFTGLWLIGLWERSNASREIKQRCGNPEAAASAYSLHDYDIAGDLGGWQALDNLRSRCAWRGIKLGSDMVPNHTGIDSRWVIEHPDRFLQLRHSPFPTYSFNGENLSHCPGIGIYLEDHYYDRSDAAVVFKRVNFNTGDTRYIYHGNDGTSMPWNDTAQIDFLNPEAREAVISTIVGVCRQFPIVRFDAAMTLAKKHIQRLWYPEPGRGGDIASRSEQSLSREEFERQIPNEFWREVVDRCAAEAPDTLLLAEAFWMMEGYFVRTLGMHRVYNSAFMNMLKMEENGKYRASIKNTLEFDPEILKRFVNFMNNPDEDTAVAQFGKGDKYFGVCTVMATMPGLPMFGHGQVEAFEEKYGMEYRRAYRNETPDRDTVDRHEREIFPLLKKRRLFSGSENFALYDVVSSDHEVNENIFAYSNSYGEDKTIVIYNNSFTHGSGFIKNTAPFAMKKEDGAKILSTRCIAQALALSNKENCFTLFMEQRSQLWFIRSSQDISEHGLYISLNGYESQVFLNLDEVEDCKYGRWGRLCRELNGKGVPDLHIAFQDLFLNDLYQAYTKLFSDTFITTLSEFCFPKSRPNTAHFTTFRGNLQEPLGNFIDIALHYLDGALGKYESFDRNPDYIAKSKELIVRDFNTILSNLYQLSSRIHRAFPFNYNPTQRWYKECREILPSNSLLGGYLAGYITFTLLRSIIGEGSSGTDACRLIEHWHIERKLAEQLEACGKKAEDHQQIIDILKWVLSKTYAEELTGNLTYVNVANMFFTDQKGRDLLGVNLFNDVTWFKKEQFEQTAIIAGLLLAIDCDSAFITSSQRSKIIRNKPHSWQGRLDLIADYYYQYKKAELLSGFQVEKFIDYLQYPPKKWWSFIMKLFRK